MKTKLQIHWPKITEGEWYAELLGLPPNSVRSDGLLVCNLSLYHSPQANARFIAASKRMAEWLVEEWVQAQHNVIYASEYGEHAAKIASDEYGEPKLRELLTAAGFSFTIETETP